MRGSLFAWGEGVGTPLCYWHLVGATAAASTHPTGMHSCSCIFDTGLVIENGRIHCTSSALEKGLYLHLQWKRVLRKTFVFVLFFYTGSRKKVSLQVHTVTAYLSRGFPIITHPLLICCIHGDWNTYRGSIQETTTIKQSDVECSKMRDVYCYWRHI